MKYSIALTLLVSFSMPAYAGDTLATSHEMRRAAIETCIKEKTQGSTITPADIEAHGKKCAEAVRQKVAAESK